MRLKVRADLRHVGRHIDRVKGVASLGARGRVGVEAEEAREVVLVRIVVALQEALLLLLRRRALRIRLLPLPCRTALRPR